MTLLLLCYFVFLIGFIIFSISGLYHLWRYGYVGDLTKPAMIIYIILSIAFISFTVVAMSFRSWPTTFTQ